MDHGYRIVYTAIGDGWFVAEAPDLPGAVTQARSIDEAREMINEAIALVLECYEEHGFPN